MIDHGLLSPVHAGHPAHANLDDDAWLAAFGTIEAALVAALANHRLIPAAAAMDIVAVAHSAVFDAAELSIGARGGANPIVGYVTKLTAAVAERSAVSARYVHHGCTSQDILDTAAMLIAKAEIVATGEVLRDIRATLGDMASTHAQTPMAARTMGAHAVPTTFGAKVAAWSRGVDIAIQRGDDLAGGLPVQLGGAGGTQASYVEIASIAGAVDPAQTVVALTETFAEILALQPSEPWHTLRIPVMDVANHACTVAGILGKIATDVITLSRTEIAELSERSGSGRGDSSAMPHKHNPALSALILSAAQQIPPLSLILMQAQSSADERSAGAWHSEWEPLRQILLLVHGAISTTRELLDGLEVHPEKMRTNLQLTAGGVCSERLAVVLGPLIGKAEAKKLLQHAFISASTSGSSLASVLGADPRLPIDISGRLVELTTPENYLGRAVHQALGAGESDARGGCVADHSG